MKSVTTSILMALTLAMLLAGCTLTRGSHLVIGNTRSPTNPDNVKIYTTLPAHYQKIAIVSADARNAFASEQNLTDNTIERLKEEAAEVGANGILLNGIGNYQIGSNGVVIMPNSSGYSSTGLITTTASTGKEAKGIAIYVPNQR